jgi:hypothetical protein
MTQELFECIRTAVELSVDVPEEFSLGKTNVGIAVAGGEGGKSVIGAVCALLSACRN